MIMITHCNGPVLQCENILFGWKTRIKTAEWTLASVQSHKSVTARVIIYFCIRNYAEQAERHVKHTWSHAVWVTTETISN